MSCAGGVCVCGCCEPGAPATPLAHANRPTLSAIGYRIGTYAEFREAMLESIARTPELASLSTRSSDDYSVTVLELWAERAPKTEWVLSVFSRSVS